MAGRGRGARDASGERAGGPTWEEDTDEVCDKVAREAEPEIRP
jgi:hypothetical protein